MNYIYGTWQVLRGLRALNLDMNQPWLLKARDWLESVQHEDGGWGERCNTYDDPVFKGQGPSTASQTAWAVMGLCAFDDPDRPSLRRGIEYLIRTQNPDGSWTEHETTGTGFPEGVLPEIRHVSERLAAAGPGHLPTHPHARRGGQWGDGRRPGARRSNAGDHERLFRRRIGIYPCPTSSPLPTPCLRGRSPTDPAPNNHS